MLCDAIFTFHSCVVYFVVDETDARSFLRRRRKTPSLLFVHIEAPLEQNQRSVLIYNEISFKTKHLRIYELFSH
jgi:hypothetical protein